MEKNDNISIEDLHMFYLLIINMIIRHNPRLREDVVEAIRVLLLKPVSTHPLSPGAQLLLRQLRDNLLDEPDQEIVSKLSSSNLRPIE